ncbi:MAG: segregation/condensation protein A [Planctomycetes bacterium]|jgi:segregation and condensation protein A|nr:segregation/condensation protein A [Planctomycetota bacterium]
MINFRLEKFTGPLGLLLQLIEREELDITQISLAKIADQYIDYIRTRGAINPDEMADFLVVAAKLLLIKSKALLPYLYPEEEQEIAELEDQLKMYKEFLEAARKIQAMLGKRKFMYAREWNRQTILAGSQIFSPPQHLAAPTLAMVFKDIIGRLKPAEKLEEEVLARKINIEEKIMYIQELLLERIKVSFNKVLATAQDKTEIIVSFLAMLELMRQRIVVLEQNELFEEIIITKR